MKKQFVLLALLSITLSSCTFKFGSSSSVEKTSSTNSCIDSNTPTGSDTTPDISPTTSTDSNTKTTSTDTSDRSGLVEVKLAGFNDFHGHIEEEGDMVGLSKMATYIKSKKAQGAIVCNSGDTWQETFLASECKGTIISKAFKDAGLDVYTVGNHDFDWGVEAIRLNEQAEYWGEELLGANIMKYPCTGSSWEKADLGKEYKTFILNEGTEQQVKVGVVGVIGKDQITSITSKFVEDYVFFEHNQIIKNVSTKLREQEGCDIVIASCHTPANQLDNSIFETNSDGTRKYIDAAFCAHDHALYSGEVNGAPVLEAQSYGRYGSEISLTFNLDSHKVESTSYENIPLASLNLQEDPIVSSYVNEFKKQCDTKGNTVYGTVKYNFNRNNLGRWQAETAALKAAELGINIDYAIVNSARSSLNRGQVNHYQMYETHPFVNDLYVVRVTGADIYGEIYNYTNPFYRVTTDALEDSNSKWYTILVYNYLLFHQSVDDNTYAKEYNYFRSLNTSGEIPQLFVDKSGNKINVLDLTIKDLQSKGTINPYDYDETNWHNTRSSLITAQ